MSVQKEPLYGFVPRRVTGEQVLKAMVMFFFFVQNFRAEALAQKDSDVNPFTKQTHSPQYKKILESRKKLPVFKQMEEFMKIVSSQASLKLEEGFEFAIFSDGPTLLRQNFRLIVACSSVKTRSLLWLEKRDQERRHSKCFSTAVFVLTQLVC